MNFSLKRQIYNYFEYQEAPIIKYNIGEFLAFTQANKYYQVAYFFIN